MGMLGWGGGDGDSGRARRGRGEVVREAGRVIEERRRRIRGRDGERDGAREREWEKERETARVRGVVMPGRGRVKGQGGKEAGSVGLGRGWTGG
jgi:hypothetical protein